MSLDCPAYLDDDGAVQCGLPAEVRCRFIMRSSDGPLESVMIRCPASHVFNAPVEFLTWDKRNRGGAERVVSGLAYSTVRADTEDGKGMYKPSQEALDKHAADVAAAAERGKLLDAARAADAAMREAEARHAPVIELHRLAKELDAVLTAAMRAAYAAQRAEIGPRGYEDRIYLRKAKAKPAVRALTTEAERLLTLRENHRMNHIPEIPREPAV